MGISIKGMGYYTPENVLTNFDLEKMVDTSDEWITTRTGIKKRRSPGFISSRPTCTPTSHTRPWLSSKRMPFAS